MSEATMEILKMNKIITTSYKNLECCVVLSI
jgi:hypothetical protein